MTTLIPPGRYLATSLPQERELRERLNDLGVTIGTTVAVRFSAPFNGPTVISVRGVDYAMRRSTLAKIGWKKL